MNYFNSLLSLISAESTQKDLKNQHGLQLCPIVLNSDYSNKWNANEKDFVCLTLNGELLNNNLYRVGGMGCNINDDYFLILKYVESYYEPEIVKHSKNKDRKHLAGIWCIYDKYGNEKVVLNKFDNPYLIKDSCLYTFNSRIYNIETGYQYNDSTSGNRIDSTDFVFVENKYDKDLTKQGIIKINKKDGSWELFK